VKLGSLDALRSSLTTLDALIEAAHTSSDSEPEIAQIIQQEQYYQPPPGPIYSPTSPEITSPNFGNGGVQNWENPKIVMPPTVTQLSNRDPQQQDPYPRHPSIPSRSTSPLAEYELSTSVSPPMSPMSELGHDSRTTSMVDGSLSAGDRVSGFSSYQWNPSGTGGAREDLERARARQRSYDWRRLSTLHMLMMLFYYILHRIVLLLHFLIVCFPGRKFRYDENSLSSSNTPVSLNKEWSFQRALLAVIVCRIL
jgi:hypothetical protein